MSKRFILVLSVIIAMIQLNACNTSSTTDQQNDKTQDVASSEKGSKKDVLTELIGEHALESISASVGANTILDYALENNVWTAIGSQNEGGMRQAEELDITAEDALRLESTKIVIDENLTLSLVNHQGVIFTIPFNADGMVLQSSPDFEASYLTEGLQPTTTFSEQVLFLYASNTMGTEALESTDIVGIGSDACVLRYNLETDVFEMTLYTNECCSESTYIFK